MLPQMVVASRQRRDMTATGTTSVTGDQGGQSVQTEVRGLVGDFYNRSIMASMGATVLTGLTGNLNLPRFVAGTAATKKTENASADEVSPTLATLSLQPKRLPAFIDLSDQLLMQSSSNIEAFVRTQLMLQMLATQEAAFFHGGGTSEANGVAGTSGIGSVAGGAAGLAPTYAHMLSLEEAVDATNALDGSLYYASNGQIRKKLKGTLENPAATDNGWILGKDGRVNGYNANFTNAISRTLTKGGSGAVASAIFFGNFADYIIGYWGGLNLELIRDSANAKLGMHCLVANTFYDGGVIRPKSFSAMLDALGA
jgi:HK97 family phage major capsid protein